jgi:carboxymethylenebutenolidase
MGYLARPAGDTPLPAIVVIQEWWGLNDHIKDVTQRFAGEGFVALAPDLYHGVSTTEPDEARKLVMELDMAAAVSEIRQAIAFLLEQEYAAGEKAGLVGFCMGGRLTLQTALVEEKLGAAVVFYGSPLMPEELLKVKAPILGLYGAEDSGIAVTDVQAMADALKEAGIEHDIQIYAGAQHAFFNDTRESYNEGAAQDAWPRTLTWLRDHLK